MKLSACLLPNDAAELLEAVLPMLAQLEAMPTAEEREEGLAKVRAWLVETSAALRRQDARGRPPVPQQGAQEPPGWSQKTGTTSVPVRGTPPGWAQPSQMGKTTGAKKSCGCEETKPRDVSGFLRAKAEEFGEDVDLPPPAETLGQGVARLLLDRLGWGRKGTTNG